MYIHNQFKTTQSESNSVSICIVLIVEHVFILIYDIFKKYDLSKNGQPDSHGIIRAPRESFIKTILICLDMVMFGYIVHQLWLKSYNEFHDESYLNYWIMIDILIMFFAHAYNYMCSKMIFN